MPNKLDVIVVAAKTAAIMAQMSLVRGSHDSFVRSDDAEFENKHPRNKSGEFIKGGASPINDPVLQTAFKKLGFAPVEKKSPTFKNETGEEFTLQQTHPEQYWMTGWLHKASGKSGKGAGALKKFIEQLQGAQQTAQAPASVTAALSSATIPEIKQPTFEQPKNSESENPTAWKHKSDPYNALVSGGMLNYSHSEFGSSILQVPNTPYQVTLAGTPIKKHIPGHGVGFVYEWFITDAADNLVKSGYGANNLKSTITSLKEAQDKSNVKYKEEDFYPTKPVPSSPESTKPIRTPGTLIQLSSLKKIGKQLGSNPGGTYEDANGNKYYVKLPENKAVAQNELAAAALYKLAGVNTFDYNPIETEAGSLGVATKWQNMAATNVNQLTSAQKKMAQQDFAVHAWLANWDAAGLTGDNIGVTADGKVTTLDVGGALAYRAKGSPKGDLFNDEASEWETLRDPAKNPSASNLFGDMTKEDLLHSFAKINNISGKEIYATLKVNGYSHDNAAALSQKLMHRRNAIIAKIKGSFEQQATPAHAGEKLDMLLDYQAKAKILNEAAKHPTDYQRIAISSYTGSSYHDMNKMLRMGIVPPKGKIKDLTSYLHGSSMPEETIVSRKLSNDYAKYLINEAELGTEVTDLGFASTSINPDAWSGELHTRVRIPKGAKAAYVNQWSSNPGGEQEVIIQRGARYKVIGISPDKKTIDLELLDTFQEK